MNRNNQARLIMDEPTRGVDVGAKAAKGEEVPKDNMIDFVLVTKDNVDQYLK